jgi:hypothetical protein
MNKKRIKITDGGYAIPLGNDYFLMRGRTHEQGGIGIGENKKNNIEVENGEIVKIGQKDIKVFSDQPMLNGISPANALLMGARPEDVFTAQQAINGNSHGSYGKDGLVKRFINWIKGSNDDKPNKDAEPLNLEELKLRQAYAESAFDSNAKSSKDAVGLFQIRENLLTDYNTAHGTNYTLEDLYDDKLNMSIRDWKMDKNLASDWATRNNAPDSVVYAKSLGGYNMGNQNFLDHLGKAKAAGVDIYNSMDWISEKWLPKETVDYINFILRNKNNSLSRNNSAYELNKKKNSDKVKGIKNGFRNGGQINMKSKSDNKIDVTKEVMDRILPTSTGERKKFYNGGVWGASNWSLLGNIGLNLLSGLGQGIAGSISASKARKMYDGLKRVSTYVPVAREHINTRVDVEPQLTINKEAESKLIKSAQENTSNSKVAREQIRQAVASRIQADHTVLGDKLNREADLRNAEAQLQTQYNLQDNANFIKDLGEQNDFEMQRALGKTNATISEGQTWGSAIASMLQNSATSIMDYATMSNDLLKSDNPAAYNEYMKREFGMYLNPDGTLKDKWRTGTSDRAKRIQQMYNKYFG